MKIICGIGLAIVVMFIVLHVRRVINNKITPPVKSKTKNAFYVIITDNESKALIHSGYVGLVVYDSYGGKVLKRNVIDWRNVERMDFESDYVYFQNEGYNYTYSGGRVKVEVHKYFEVVTESATLEEGNE